mmetsp:Transcript_15334/g.53453  ORF Transcript_15334/g.53453 Transcript_15334/m.53453 type:complete len:400 (+) Transcript_15334:160-1359(+)
MSSASRREMLGGSSTRRCARLSSDPRSSPSACERSTAAWSPSGRRCSSSRRSPRRLRLASRPPRPSSRRTRRASARLRKGTGWTARRGFWSARSARLRGFEASRRTWSATRRRRLRRTRRWFWLGASRLRLRLLTWRNRRRPTSRKRRFGARLLSRPFPQRTTRRRPPPRNGEAQTLPDSRRSRRHSLRRTRLGWRSCKRRTLRWSKNLQSSSASAASARPSSLPRSSRARRGSWGRTNLYRTYCTRTPKTKRKTKKICPTTTPSRTRTSTPPAARCTAAATPTWKPRTPPNGRPSSTPPQPDAPTRSRPLWRARRTLHRPWTLTATPLSTRPRRPGPQTSRARSSAPRGTSRRWPTGMVCTPPIFVQMRRRSRSCWSAARRSRQRMARRGRRSSSLVR